MSKVQLDQRKNNYSTAVKKELTVGGFWQSVQDFQQLIKLRLTLTVVFSSIMVCNKLI